MISDLGISLNHITNGIQIKVKIKIRSDQGFCMFRKYLVFSQHPLPCKKQIDKYSNPVQSFKTYCPHNFFYQIYPV